MRLPLKAPPSDVKALDLVKALFTQRLQQMSAEGARGERLASDASHTNTRSAGSAEGQTVEHEWWDSCILRKFYQKIKMKLFKISS